MCGAAAKKGCTVMREKSGSGPRQVSSPDGTSIAVWSTGTGPPLLLVHGSMSDHRRWRITEFLDGHRTVHAMDRRGRGGSTDGPAWSLGREIEDVVAVIDTLADEAGLPVDVLGHSLGGYFALHAAGGGHVGGGDRCLAVAAELARAGGHGSDAAPGGERAAPAGARPGQSSEGTDVADRGR